MKRRSSLLLLLISCLSVACGEDTPARQSPFSSPYREFIEPAAKYGFEVEFKENIYYDDNVISGYEILNYSLLDDYLSIKLLRYDLNNDEYIINDYSILLTDNATYCTIDSLTLETYKKNGWIDYNVEAFKSSNGEWHIYTFDFEILNPDLCPILEVPDKSNCRAMGYVPYEDYLLLFVYCKIDYTKYYNYDKAQMLDVLINKWQENNETGNFKTFYHSLLYGYYRLNYIQSYPDRYLDVEMVITDSTYLDRDVIKYSVSYDYKSNDDYVACVEMIIFDKETGMSLYVGDPNDELHAELDVTKFSIGADN